MRTITLARIQRHDSERGTSLARSLEMTIDGIGHVAGQGVTLQFWRDLDLYGIDAATVFVQRCLFARASGADKSDEANILTLSDELSGEIASIKRALGEKEAS